MVAAVAAAFTAWLLGQTGLHQFLETSLTLPYYHKLREWTGTTPAFHPGLKILAYDDTTFAAMQSAELSLEQWVTLLESLDRTGPATIIIDQIFAMVPRTAHDRAALLERLRALRTPVVTTAFLTPSAIKTRQQLNLDHPWYRLQTFYENPLAIWKSRFPPVDHRPGWFAYGPNPELAGIFRRAGHAMNAGPGFAAAFIQTQNGTVVPHAALLGGSKITIDNGQFRYDDKPIPMTDDGRIMVNYLRKQEYFKRTKKILNVLKDIGNGTAVPGIGAGDTILIIPAMFTGNTDLSETPIGSLPGGMVVATLINSRLSGNWITPVSSRDGPLYFALLTGMAAALVPAGWLLIAGVAGILLVLAASGLTFAMGGCYVTISDNLVAMLLMYGWHAAEKIRLRDRLVFVINSLRTENQNLQTELSQAGEISRAFITATPPRWQDFSIGVYHKPMTEASGDWYQFERSRSGRYMHFAMCDISGHGVQAAIIVSTCKTVFSMVLSEKPEIPESETFLEHYAFHLNKTLLLQGSGRHTTTFAGVTIDTWTGQLYSVCAGHPRPIIFRHADKNQASFVGKPGSILGMNQDPAVRAAVTVLSRGDSVLIYTDGVQFPRALNKVAAIFNKYRHLSPDSSARYMAVESWERQKAFGSFAEDDISLVCIRWTGEARSAPQPAPAPGSKPA